MKAKKVLLGVITAAVMGGGCVKSYMYLNNKQCISNKILLANVEAFSANPPEETLKTGVAVPEGEVCHILEVNGFWRGGKRVVCHNEEDDTSACVEGSCAYVKN